MSQAGVVHIVIVKVVGTGDSETVVLKSAARFVNDEVIDCRALDNDSGSLLDLLEMEGALDISLIEVEHGISTHEVDSDVFEVIHWPN